MVDCETNIAVVTWDSALGGESYVVSAWGDRGYNSTCVNTDTTCSFSDLVCGQNYNITVVARNADQCSGPPSQTISVSTGVLLTAAAVSLTQLFFFYC